MSSRNGIKKTTLKPPVSYWPCEIRIDFQPSDGTLCKLKQFLSLHLKNKVNI